jgi:methyl-accepting chemotaxis protein
VVFGIERLFFRVLGQGWIIDLAEDSETNLEKGIYILENSEEQPLINSEKKAIDLIMSKSLGYSSKFGQGIKNLSTTIKYFVYFLIVLCVGGLILLILNILRNTIPSLEETVQVLEKIANGNLKVNVNQNASGEVGRIQLAMKCMLTGLQDMIGDIHLIVDKLIRAANESAKITDQTLIGVKTQKDETELLSSSIREMSIAVNEVATSAANAATSATSASDGNKAADKGKYVVLEAVESINLLAAEVESSVVAIQRIEAGSDKIGSVVKIIKDITTQTNLLALNAAIEAAHAGEFGKGFSVVADQVRVLAEQTESSTMEIQIMIKELRSSTQAAVEIMAHSQEQALSSVEKAQQAGDTIDEIVSAVSTITMMNEQIASATEEQNVVTSEITGNAEVINSIAEKAEVGGNEVLKSNKNLIEISDTLSSVVKKFEV